MASGIRVKLADSAMQHSMTRVSYRTNPAVVLPQTLSKNFVSAVELWLGSLSMANGSKLPDFAMLAAGMPYVP
jgi:hypothetical protein